MYRRLLHRGSIPFEIPQLNFRGKTEGDGILMGYNEDDKSLSIPLAILSVSQETSRKVWFLLTRNASGRKGAWNKWNDQVWGPTGLVPSYNCILAQSQSQGVSWVCNMLRWAIHVRGQGHNIIIIYGKSLHAKNYIRGLAAISLQSIRSNRSSWPSGNCEARS